MNESNGYVKAPHDIVRSPSLSPAAKVAWLLIAGMPDGYQPRREQWMAMLPCGDKRVWWKAIQELENAGLVEVTKQGTKKCYKATIKGANQHQIKGAEQHRKRVQINTEEWCKSTPNKRCEIAPYKKNIIEEQIEDIVDDAGAPARERFVQEINQDYAIEQACMSLGIDTQTYMTLSQQVIAEWQFRDLPESEWTRMHFLSVMRYKVKELKRNGIHQPTPKRRSTVTGPISGPTQGKNPLADYPTYPKTGS